MKATVFVSEEGVLSCPFCAYNTSSEERMRSHLILHGITSITFTSREKHYASIERDMKSKRYKAANQPANNFHLQFPNFGAQQPEYSLSRDDMQFWNNYNDAWNNG